MDPVLNMQSICFVSRDNYPVLNPSMGTTRIGGESVQQTLLATEFVRAGFDVSMIVIDHGQPDGEVIDGIKVFKTYNPRAGLPGLRFVHPRATGVIKALQRANADVYYQSCASVLTGYVAWHCMRNRKKFVFRVASDTDCIPGRQLIGFWRDRKLYEYGLKRANLILTQSQKQVKLLEHNYDLNSTFMNMVVEAPSESLPPPGDIDVLWVSNLRPLKRPDILIELAQKLPQHRFVMIGGPCPRLDGYYREIESAARTVGNLEFLGPVPYKDMGDYFSRAKVFVNTSDIEGFPNTFLQSWIHGVPVVSFFDPDDLIEKKGLGSSPADLTEMIRVVEELMSNDDKRRELSRRVKQFALENHSPQSILDRHLRVFSEAF
jgi:glycosyltransferase involved in cell wall biosynthesis